MGTNMYPSSSLLGQDKDSNVSGLPVDELIEKADGFAGVFPGMFVALFSGIYTTGNSCFSQDHALISLKLNVSCLAFVEDLCLVANLTYAW